MNEFLSKHCGQGYALEAANIVLKHELSRHSLQSILANTRPDNLSSNQLLRQAAFIETGVIICMIAKIVYTSMLLTLNVKPGIDERIIN
jgi:RimJ/RimL family protein N-acetyltransferase